MELRTFHLKSTVVWSVVAGGETVEIFLFPFSLLLLNSSTSCPILSLPLALPVASGGNNGETDYNATTKESSETYVFGRPGSPVRQYYSYVHWNHFLGCALPGFCNYICRPRERYWMPGQEYYVACNMKPYMIYIYRAGMSSL